jgi:hypothetical protein
MASSPHNSREVFVHRYCKSWYGLTKDFDTFQYIFLCGSCGSLASVAVSTVSCRFGEAGTNGAARASEYEDDVSRVRSSKSSLLI